MSSSKYWPFIVFMPIEASERAKYVSTLFSSPVALEVLNIFKLDRSLCQGEIIRSMDHHSNKTILTMLKRLVNLGLLSEETRLEWRGKRRVKVKCYKLTELGKWYNLLFKDPKSIDAALLKENLVKLTLEFLNKFIEFSEEIGLSTRNQVDGILTGALRAITERSSKHLPDLVVFGSIAFDIYLTHGLRVYPGGSGANVAAIASSLGLRTCLATRIPIDPLGLQSVVELIEAGVDVSLVDLSKDLKTTICTVLHELPHSPKVSCSYDPLNPPVLTQLNNRLIDFCRASKAIYIGEGVNRVFIDLLKEVGGGKLVVYRPHKLSIDLALNEFLSIMSYGPVVVLNDDKVEALESRGVRVPSELFKHGARSIVVTRGFKGSLLYESPGSMPVEYKAPEVKAIDPLGAGDVFSAVLIYCLLKGLDLRSAVEKSTLKASDSTMQLGPRKAISMMEFEEAPPSTERSLFT
ncbi:MAG: PfkB family carbohydrate kinase [Sulfolobales archaeon]|nr:PfkB family carbohydrate kinase [Sulfolobales archaeon]MCX8199698.1 PfkB family carbohydrate kinase [Sulfolobales archaeon]MDW8170652.1 PfkB family carbohydrate kinase [Desulfurococcaceae archaeon]